MFFLVACTHTSRHAEWLEQAEKHYLSGRNDSTLTTLYKINPQKLSTEENYTYHRLKFSIILQNQKDALDLMQEIADHYQQQNDTVNLNIMRSILFHNFFYHQQYIKADSVLQPMFQVYTHRNDTNGILRCYSMKSNLFQQQNMLDSALFYVDKQIAIEKPNPNVKYRYNQKADLLRRIQAYTAAEACLDSAKAIALELKDSVFLYQQTERYSQLYTQQKRYAELLNLIHESRKYMQRNDVASHNMYKAHTYELLHQKDSAIHYYDIVAKSENLFLASEALNHLSQHYLTDNDAEKAFIYHQDATGYIHQVYQAYQSQAKDKAFNELKLRSEIDELKINRQHQAIIILSLVIFLLAFIACIIIYIQSKKKKELEILQRQTKQENQLLHQAKELAELREKANTLREVLIRKMEVFQKLPSLNENKESADHAIRISEQEWSEIRNMLDAEYNQFTTRLCKAIPSLTPADVNVCCLLKINVSIQDLANIYCINKQSVSRRKQRIKEKIGNELLQGLTLDEFLQRF